MLTTNVVFELSGDRTTGKIRFGGQQERSKYKPLGTLKIVLNREIPIQVPLLPLENIIKQKKPTVKLRTGRSRKQKQTAVKPTVKQSVEDNLTAMETSVPIQRPVETEAGEC